MCHWLVKGLNDGFLWVIRVETSVYIGVGRHPGGCNKLRLYGYTRTCSRLEKYCMQHIIRKVFLLNSDDR